MRYRIAHRAASRHHYATAAGVLSRVGLAVILWHNGRVESSTDFERLCMRARAINPLMVDGIAEIDLTLLVEALSMSPIERLRVCSDHLRCLRGFVRVTSEDG